MFWELIATFIAGLGASGIVLSLRLIFKKIPKWLVPAAAGLGMIGFGVFNEYDWYRHTSTRLPDGAVVVASYAEPVFYQPWSYVKAPIRRFIVLDTNAIKPTSTPEIKQAQLYFIERRMPTHTLPVSINCTTGQQQLAGSNWQANEMSDTLKKFMCH